MPKLTKSELKAFRALLVEQREALSGSIRAMEGEALKSSEQDFSVDHMADHGSDNFEQDFTLGLIESEEERLREIDEALARTRAGTYGDCEACGKPIAKTRLRAIPWTRHCIDCQRAAEREIA
ncbi:MAG TPA: TraR/DksA family transcriptional regulator [Planctomycetota bacterium]|jgi:RNA polymerase-binding protein DksA|nr:TraR/DksA family transcriptional regulator [Planctomycetota bacterium]